MKAHDLAPRIRAVTSTFRRPEHRSGRGGLPALLALALLIGAALFAGCGSNSSSSRATGSETPTASANSSTPAYCSAVSDLHGSIKTLPSAAEVKRGGASALKESFAQVKQDATTAVNQAKSDFSSQTTALASSVGTLSTTVVQISAVPTPHAIAQLPAQVSGVTTAANDLQSAMSSKCG